jgi:regulator of replication initiation timing
MDHMEMTVEYLQKENHSLKLEVDELRQEIQKKELQIRV